MTAGARTRQSTRTPRPGRIIERPRLIKQLDAAEAPVILIVAPAGYGKTTLARQWARTLNGVIWVSCTPSHRDVVTFAEDVAAGIDALGGNASRFIGEYMHARSNPQRAAREIAKVLARKLAEVPVQWLVVDDYQELMQSPEVEEMVTILGESDCLTRTLITSRTRPSWATSRASVHGDVAEVGQSELAMTRTEAAQVVGKRPDLNPLLDHARGWPAVVCLLARLNQDESRTSAPTTIHAYVADELYRYAGSQLQQQLLRLALMPTLDRTEVARNLGVGMAESVLESAADLGFIDDREAPKLHPLVRDFLLTKLSTSSTARPKLIEAVDRALSMEAWDFALDLVLRFELHELVDPVLQRVVKPLTQSGRLGTLTGLRTRMTISSSLPPPAIDVVESEIAMRDGQFVLASDLARRATAALDVDHALVSRAFQIVGRAGFFSSSFTDAAAAYRDARKYAADTSDEAESVFGLASVQIFGEEGDPLPAVAELEQHRYRSTTELLRYATTLINFRRFSSLADPLPIEDAIHRLRDATDPQARTAFTYTASYLFAQRTDYRRAAELLELLCADIRDYELDFIQPFADWLTASVHIGTRQFGSADRCLQRVEDIAAAAPATHHDVNARMLRARLMLETGRPDDAIELLEDEPKAPIFPSWRGEFRATRALALACVGCEEDALALADLAAGTSRFVEIAVLAQSARAVVQASRGDATASQKLFFESERTGVWDPALCALRASQPLLTIAANDQLTRSKLSTLLTRCDDFPTARRAGLRSRSRRAASELLTPREIEILGMVAQGMRNKEIATALFVEESTIKVHVRHFLEKLGVRTRAEAVARFERDARTNSSMP